MSKKIDALPRAPKQLIATPEALKEVCGHLASHKRFGFDTEFIGETSYRPILCLVQVATDERVELIDPLAIKDLGPLWELIADESVEKICHAGDQDLALAWMLGKKPPRNIFDSQIGAGFVGTGYPIAYWRLVEQFCGVELDKAHTFSAWDRRPLSRSQFTYAVDDVAYLPVIHRMLGEKIESLGHTAWMREACGELAVKAAAEFDIRQVFSRIKGAGNLDGMQLAVLRELTIFREQLAFEHDVPARTMMKDEVLMDLAQRMPGSVEGILKIKNMPREEVATYGEDILTAIKRGRAVPADERPTMPATGEDSMETKRLAEIMYAASQVICLGQAVSPSLVTSQAEVLSLARRVNKGEDLSVHPLMSGWAFECLGEPLVRFVRGELGMELKVGEGRMWAKFS